jgi:hypothetical protein
MGVECGQQIGTVTHNILDNRRAQAAVYNLDDTWLYGLPILSMP